RRRDARDTSDHRSFPVASAWPKTSPKTSRLDTIPQVGFAIATWLPTQHRELGTRQPVSSNGPLFRRDNSLCPRAAHRKSRRNTGLSLGGAEVEVPYAFRSDLVACQQVGRLPPCNRGRH